MSTHQTSLEIDQPVPGELEVGAKITLGIKLSCSESCDLRGFPIKVTAADGAVIAGEREDLEGVTVISAISLRAPEQVGEHAWTVLFPRHEIEGVVHEESGLVVSFTTTPHTTSMAVWGVPSTVVVSGSFTVKVGVKCSSACPMAGRSIEVCDETGLRIGESRLGETPWPGSTALYVANVELVAPATPGLVSWSARFAASESGLPHAEASAAFCLRTVRVPEHSVRVMVTDKDTKAPLENVEVRLGFYRASTDPQGLASLDLPAGVYDLDAWKTGYGTLSMTVEVSNDLMVQVETVSCPQSDSDDSQVWM